MDGTVYRYSSNWINYLETEDHWRLYWQQQKIMDGLIAAGENVLEIGVGTWFTANYLRSRGVNVSTIDIDANKSPDIVANIVTYDFRSPVDHVLAFEVLEHIPFGEAVKVLERIRGSTKGFLFLSVPKKERVWLRWEIWSPFIGRRQLKIATPRGRIVEQHHFWEVGPGQVRQPFLEKQFAESGFRIERTAEKLSRLFYALAPMQTESKGNPMRRAKANVCKADALGCNHA